MHPPDPRPSAVVVLHRPDGALYLVMRPKTSRFFPGHYAFPGGAVEAEDGDQPLSVDALRRCAARELAEETLVELAPEDLVPAGVTVTPPFSPIRYHTQFFLHELPEGQEPEPQAPELAGGRWFFPDEALQAWRDGRARIPPPVLHVLEVADHRGLEHLTEHGTEPRAFPITFAQGLRVEPLEVGTLPPHTHTNTFLVGEGDLAVVDPGPSGEALEPLVEGIRDLLDPGDELRYVLLTHHHGDHVGGVPELVETFGCEVLASSGTAERVPFDVDRTLVDGEALEVGGVRVRAHATPGHAPGHMAYHVVTSRTLLPGDLVAGVGSVLVPPDEGDMAAYLDSLRAMIGLVETEGVRLMFPAHGPPAFKPVRKLQQTLDGRLDRERRVLAAVQEGHEALPAIAAAAYHDKPEAPRQLRELSTRAHLDKLHRETTIRRQGERWVP